MSDASTYLSLRQIRDLQPVAQPWAMKIGDRLRTLRERAKLGQADIAAAIDVSIPTVSEWERNKKKPGRERIAALAKFHSVPIDYIMTGSDLMLPDASEVQEERSLVTLYRASDKQTQVAIMTLLRAASVSKE